MKNKLSIVIPLYNEADNIKLLVSEISESLADTFELELVLVDDHSIDGTILLQSELSMQHR